MLDNRIELNQVRCNDGLKESESAFLAGIDSMTDDEITQDFIECGIDPNCIGKRIRGIINESKSFDENVLQMRLSDVDSKISNFENCQNKMKINYIYIFYMIIPLILLIITPFNFNEVTVDNPYDFEIMKKIYLAMSVISISGMLILLHFVRITNQKSKCFKFREEIVKRLNDKINMKNYYLENPFSSVIKNSLIFFPPIFISIGVMWMISSYTFDEWSVVFNVTASAGALILILACGTWRRCS